MQSFKRKMIKEGEKTHCLVENKQNVFRGNLASQFLKYPGLKQNLFLLCPQERGGVAMAPPEFTEIFFYILVILPLILFFLHNGPLKKYFLGPPLCILI